MDIRQIAALLALAVPLIGCAAAQRQQAEQIKASAHAEASACAGATRVEKWRCFNAVLIRENEALHNPNMDLVQMLAAAHLRIAADRDAGRITDVEAEARHREAFAAADGAARQRNANARVQNAITNRLDADTTATYTNMITTGLQMMR